MSQEGANSYKAFEPQPSSLQASFPSAALVFGTQDSAPTTATSVFGFNPSGVTLPPAPPTISSIFGSKPAAPPPSAPQLSFGKLKLSFGESGNKGGKPPAVFQFPSPPKPKEKGKDEDNKQPPVEGPTFSIGVSGNEKRSKSPRRKCPQFQVGKDDRSKSLERSISSEPPPSILSSSPVKQQALSPAVAECQRAIFAAFLWQESLVHDAMAAASYLKFHPDITKEMRLDLAKKERKTSESSKKDEEENVEEEEQAGTGKGDEESASKPVLPPTLNHLITFWDEIAVKVIDNSSSAFPPPKVPALADELQRQYEEEKKEMEKLKKEKSKKVGEGGGGRWWRNHCL